MTPQELFIIKESLHLLASKAHQDLINGDLLAGDYFDAIAQLEQQFTNAYYSSKGIA